MLLLKKQVRDGPVAQLVRAPPCHGGGRRFESVPGRSFIEVVSFLSKRLLFLFIASFYINFELWFNKDKVLQTRYRTLRAQYLLRIKIIYTYINQNIKYSLIVMKYWQIFKLIIIKLCAIYRIVLEFIR